MSIKIIILIYRQSVSKSSTGVLSFLEYERIDSSFMVKSYNDIVVFKRSWINFWIYLYCKNSSIDKPISFAICLSKIGEISRPLWKGTVVHLPSEWRYCLCEPRCRTSLKSKDSRIDTTSRGLRIGYFPIIKPVRHFVFQ